MAEFQVSGPAGENVPAKTAPTTGIIVPKRTAPREAEDKNIELPGAWEIDSLKYQEARNQLRHLSFALYLTLTFFMAISGWFLNFGESRPYLALSIGSIFLFLLYVLAKNTRISEDNIKLVKKLERAYKSKTRFRPTGIEGIANFLSYVVLSALTAYFLLYPYSYQLSYHDTGVFGRFLGLSGVLFLASYYILGDGKYGKASMSKIKLGKKFLSFLNKKAKSLQGWCYRITYIALAIYWYVTWF